MDSEWPRAALLFSPQTSLFPDPAWRGLLLERRSPPASAPPSCSGGLLCPPARHPSLCPQCSQGRLLPAQWPAKVPQNRRDLKTKALGSGPIVKSLGSKKNTAPSVSFERVFQNVQHPSGQLMTCRRDSFRPNQKKKKKIKLKLGCKHCRSRDYTF